MSVLWNFIMNNADVIGVIIGFVSLMVPIIWRASNRIQKALQAANERRMKEFKAYVNSENAASEARLKDYVQSVNAASEARLKDYVQSVIKSEIAASEARLKEYFHNEILEVYSKIGEVDAKLR